MDGLVGLKALVVFGIYRESEVRQGIVRVAIISRPKLSDGLSLADRANPTVYGPSRGGPPSYSGHVSAVFRMTRYPVTLCDLILIYLPKSVCWHRQVITWLLSLLIYECVGRWTFRSPVSSISRSRLFHIFGLNFSNQIKIKIKSKYIYT